MKASWTAALLALVFVGLLAGCGGGKKPKTLSKAAYVEQIKALAGQVSGLITSTNNAATTAAEADALSKVQAELRTDADKLGKVAPPSNAAAAHGKLVTGLGDLARELDPVIAKVKGGNRDALAAITSLKGFTEILAAAQELSKAGYDVLPT